MYIFLKNYVLKLLNYYSNIFNNYYQYLIYLKENKNKNENENKNKNTNKNKNKNTNENKNKNTNENENEIKEFKKIQKNGLELFIKKNKDYGKAYEKYGAIGILVRVNDKISRLQTITKNKICLVDDESLKDTLIDLHNYSAIALMELNKE